MNARRFTPCARFRGCSPFYARLLSLFLLLSAATGLQAQITIYAKFLDGAGPWAGELTGARQGWTRLNSAGLSFTNPSTVGSTGSPVAFDPATLVRPVNKLTPQIFANMVSGGALRNLNLPADLTIEFEMDGPAGPVVFYRIELRYIIFTSQKTVASTGDENIPEEVQLQFGAARLTAWNITAGGLQGTPKIDTWNRVRNNSDFNDVP